MNLIEAQQELLHKAGRALHDRSFYAAYPDHPKVYGEEAQAKALEWFNRQLGADYSELMQTGQDDLKGSENSPYTGESLNIRYPFFEPEKLVQKAKAVQREWQHASPETRAAILLDSLERIKNRFFDIAYATMHTTGQSFLMSFQASGPHANDRALEALVLGYQELKRFPNTADWEKPMGKFSIKVKKTWRAMGRGVGLVIGCSTFPVWNSVPGIYASLITGNPVIMKPHPGGILPIAIVVGEIQKSLVNAGFSTDIIQLAPDTSDEPITKKLAEHKQVKVIDYTGGSRFGEYLEKLEGKVVFTEKAGVNSVILDSATDLDAVIQNLAFAASLYSGQMCTAPQNFFVPENGIKVNDTVVSFEEVVQKFVEAIKGLANHPKMGAGTLGAIQSPNTTQRLVDVADMDAEILLHSATIENPEFPNARTASPMILKVDATNREIFSHELFGPIVIFIKTNDTKHSVSLAKELAIEKGAISCGAYTTDPAVKEHIADEMEEAFTPVAFNLTGPIWMNQNAAFSDFHVTGGNPAGNATFTDAAYIVRRFAWVGHKEMIAE